MASSVNQNYFAARGNVCEGARNAIPDCKAVRAILTSCNGLLAVVRRIASINALEWLRMG